MKRVLVAKECPCETRSRISEKRKEEAWHMTQRVAVQQSLQRQFILAKVISMSVGLYNLNKYTNESCPLFSPERRTDFWSHAEASFTSSNFSFGRDFACDFQAGLVSQKVYHDSMISGATLGNSHGKLTNRPSAYDSFQRAAKYPQTSTFGMVQFFGAHQNQKRCTTLLQVLLRCMGMSASVRRLPE